MSDFFTPAELAELLDPASGLGTTVQIDGDEVSCVFWNGYNESLGIDGSNPAMLCRSADVEAYDKGASVVHPSQGSFTLVRVRDSKQGHCMVDLQAVTA